MERERGQSGEVVGCRAHAISSTSRWATAREPRARACARWLTDGRACCAREPLARSCVGGLRRWRSGHRAARDQRRPEGSKKATRRLARPALAGTVDHDDQAARRLGVSQGTLHPRSHRKVHPDPYSTTRIFVAMCHVVSRLGTCRSALGADPSQSAGHH